MADIKPFRGIRPAGSLAKDIAALPYDVYSREEAREEALSHPLSFLNIDRPEVHFPPEQDMFAPQVYRKAHDLLWEMVEKGNFIQDDIPCYYLYELTMNGRAQTGIVACASIDDYESGVIKKHENTRAQMEQDRIRHVDACNAQTGPIFLAYRKDETLQAAIRRAKKSQPLFDFTTGDGVTHRGWRIREERDTAGIRTAFEKIDRIYIADGHHRAASAVKVGQMRRRAHPDYDGTEEFNYFLSVLFPDEELMIMDYNRVVRDLNGLTPTEFLDAAGEKCRITPLGGAASPEKKGQMTMRLEGRWYLLEFKQEYLSRDAVEGLDVSALQREILAPILKITDPKQDERIDFVGGIRGLGELERLTDGDWAVAFAMHPTSIGELFAVADAGALMPPKSTWFEPKLRSGLFIHELGR